MTTYDSNYAYNMATQLAQYDTQYSYSRLDRNKTNYTAQQTAINSLSSALSTFQTKLSGLNSVSGSILQNKATLSSEGYASANVTSKAQAGSYQFHVAQLASKHQLAFENFNASELRQKEGDDFARDADGNFVFEGKFQISHAGNSIEIDLSQLKIAAMDGAEPPVEKTAEAVNNEALTYIAKTINDSSLNEGVRASIVTANGVKTLMISSTDSGESNKITVAASPSVPGGYQQPPALAALLQTNELSKAQDAEVYLGADTNGIKLTNASNTFNNIIEGVSLTFSKVHKDGDAPLTLDIAQDNDGTKAKVQEFVDAYNALAGELKKLTASGSEDSKRGPLAGDGTVRSIKSMIDSMIRKGVTVDGQQVSLVSLGISSTREGTLTLDGARLEKTLAANPGALDALFKGTSLTDKGILGSLLDRESGLAKYTSSVNGILKNRKDSIADSLKRIDRERERVDTQYDNLYQRYLSQYTNLVTIMNQMSQTSSLYFT